MAFQLVWLLHDKAFIQGLPILGVEPAPEDGVVLTSGDSSRVEEWFTKCVEFAVVINDVSLVVHVLPGILVGEVQQLLL